ncbi:gfo/Idh/MocA family oxidoreductase [Pontibacillus yanchengensis]|uniref:Gfo/Idh/MocA family oxidoreductase n=2 Tax=Pontibacillus yanchengensis TaxID=462910 RepID=A0ACC7VGT8_9BACI|nr:Gfo/Idh/MocA family oxidoreductase [Pontibacillus yanchengensis]MYL33892.1 gfo/Idh/MocA family oxidoreductase [Pontibacillus yanchengensis]MYL53917.1 gfo/Idh/MocA family oxidoreductase [Pontibacillus yanchengensis]
MNVGVIGTGSISELHLKGYDRLKEVRILAVCDTNMERAREKASQFGAEYVFEDYNQLLALEMVDAVSICTWNNTHAEIAIAALKAGKDVLVEKPLCMSIAEARAVEAAVHESGQMLQVGFVRRHGTNAKVLKTFIDNGELGEIYYAKATCTRRIGNPGGWFADKERSGGGPLIDLGVHMIDLCWYLMGKPKLTSVVGHTYHKLGNRANIDHLSFYQAADYDPDVNTVEDMANALLHFQNGASMMVDVSFSLHKKENEVAACLYGDKGGAEIEPKLGMFTEKYNTMLNTTPQIDSLTFDFENGFNSEIEHFIKSCKREEEPISPIEDGVEMMKMLTGIYESACLEQEVRFD